MKEDRQELLVDKKPDPEPEKTPQKSNAWLLWTVGAVACFTIGNVVISELTNQSGGGLFSFFYLTSGAIVAGLCYNFIQMVKYKRFWNNQNIIVGGHFQKRNCLGFFLNCLCNFFVMNMCILTMYFANKAGVNVGVITTITSINPFFTAVVDYFIYKIILRYHHILGMISIVLGSVFICLNGTFEPSK